MRVSQEIQDLRKRVGYDGKSQQWQYGFDLACREKQAEIDELDSLLNQAGEVFEIMRVADEHLAKLFKGSTAPTFTPVSNLLPGIVMPTVDSLEAAINESVIEDLMGGRPIPATVTVKQVGTYGVNLSPEEIADLKAIAAERKQAQMQMRTQWLEEIMKLDSDSSEPVPPPPLPPIIGQIYECVGKGGSYECLGLAKPAGEAKDEIGEVYAYRCTKTGQLYFRLPSDFNERMRLKGELKPDHTVDDLGLSTSTLNILKSENIYQLTDLLKNSAVDLLKIPNFGKKRLSEVLEAVAKRDLRLKDGA